MMRSMGLSPSLFFSLGSAPDSKSWFTDDEQETTANEEKKGGRGDDREVSEMEKGEGSKGVDSQESAKRESRDRASVVFNLRKFEIGRC